MPEPTPPRRPAFGHGKTTPPRPAPKPQLPYEVVDDPVSTDTGFEVVDDTAAAPKAPASPPVARLAKPVKATPAAPPKARSPLKAEPADDEDEKPRPPKLKADRRGKPVDDEDEDDRPRPTSKKKKRKRDRSNDPLAEEDERQAARDKALADFEWMWPSLLLGLGLILCLVGALGTSKVSALITLGVMAIGLVVTIPATIAVLMVVGIFMGIEYGRIGPAILKIAAISFVANGIMFIGDWLHLPGMIVFPISCGISFGLFMTQFDLDTWETNVSVGALNVMAFVANIILLTFLVAAASGGGGGGGVDPDDDDAPPADTRRERGPGGEFQPPVMEDEGDDE